MKVCNTCHLEKSKDEFSKHSKSKDGLNWKCKACSNRTAKEWRTENPDARKRHNMAKYGITVSDWDRMFSEQAGVCAICKKEVEDLHVDHDHASGVVRGLLCRNCNLGLGQFMDDTEILLDAVQYLEDRKQVK